LWKIRLALLAATLLATVSCGQAQQHPLFRLSLLGGWRAAVQTSEADAAFTRRVALAARPDVVARARWNIDRRNNTGLIAEASWASQSTAIGQGSTTIVTRLDYIYGTLGAALGPLWMGVSYGQPLMENVQVADVDATEVEATHHHDGSRLAAVADVRLGIMLPVVVTAVGDVEVGLVLGTAVTSAYQSQHPGLLRAAWLRLDLGWTIELW